MTEDTKAEIPTMLFYCKDCQKVVVDPKKYPRRYAYSCPVCKGPKIVFGTHKSITDFFHIKEVALDKMLKGE